MDRLVRLGMLWSALAWPTAARAQPAAPCPSSGQPWVQIIFSGAAWSKPLQEAVLRELRTELQRRALQACTEPDGAPWAPPRKLFTLLASDTERVAIVPSDLGNEGGFVGRTIALGVIPEDARPLAIAQAVDEALRSDAGPLPAPPAAPPSVPDSREHEPSNPTRLESVLGVAVAPALQVAPAIFEGASRAVVAPGITLRLSMTPGRFGGSLGFTVARASDLAFGAVLVRQFRLPVDLSARVRFRTGLLHVACDLGVLAALVDYDYAPSGRGRRWVEPGARAGFSIAWGRRMRPWLGASIEVLPSSTELRFDPTGGFGRTPALWLGLALGTELAWP